MISISEKQEYTVKMEQVFEGLEPGFYYLTAYAQKGAGESGNDDQKVCYLYGQGSNQKNPSMTMIPRRGVEEERMEWTEITVRGIEVGEDGKAAVGVYTEGYAGNWLNVDKLTLTREKNQESQYRLLKGGDISMLTLLEDYGAKFYDPNGREGDVLQILADHGWNIVRIRLYNNPGKGRGVEGHYCPEGYCNLEDTIALARRAKEKGMQIQYSFHYSDYWTNAAVHLIPAEWKAAIEGKSYEEAVDILEGFMYTYTKEVLETLAEQGIRPEYISLGNEMQNGMLYPYGEATEKGWPNLARFLKAAARAVREAAPNARIILHSDGAGDEPRYENLFGNCRTYQVDYDIIGVSYYPFWVNLSVKDVISFCNTLVDRYDKDIILMETGFNFDDCTENGYPGQLAHNGPYPYGNGASSPANQREFMAELFNGLKCVKDGRCIGDLYWDPIMVAQKGIGWAVREDTDTMSVNVVSNTTLFDFDHKLLPAASAYMYNQEGKQAFVEVHTFS